MIARGRTRVALHCAAFSAVAALVHPDVLFRCNDVLVRQGGRLKLPVEHLRR